MYCLETASLSHRYSSDDFVLNGIDLQVPQRSIYGFLGPNGAGKTTTLRLILGLLKTQQGTISVFGKRFEANRIEILRNIGSLIESPSLYEHLTAGENLTLLQKVHRCPKSRISEVLELVGLPNTGRKKVGGFSLGMKQRMSIAVALLHNPTLLILDEPTNGLDPSGIIEMRQMLTKLNQERGITIVISSHLLSEIEKLATHLGVIHHGQMVFQGTIEELRRNQKQVFSIYISSDNNDAALKVIAHHVPSARVEDGRIVVSATSNEHIALINRTLIQSGLAVYEIRPVNNDLESIFMDLVGGSKQ